MAKIAHDFDTPFAKSIPRPRWVKWSKFRNPNLTLRGAHGLEQGRAKGLCLENVASLHDNLQDMLHIVTPNKREWLFVLSCINASGSNIPNFFLRVGHLGKNS